MIKNTINSYGSVSKFFHWVLALLVTGALIAGVYMTDLPDENSIKFQIYAIHEVVGVSILTLAVLSILWRWGNELPRLPSDMNRFLKFLSRFVHYSLYILLVLTPFSGMMMTLYGGYPIDFFGYFSIPALSQGPTNLAHLMHEIHENLLYFWLIFIGVHVVGAFYHLLVHRDRIMQRMLPWGKA